jgi:hypothetical protein
MKVIGDRVSILKKDDLLSIVILPTVDRKKLSLLLLWITAWTVCGLIVFANYFNTTDQNSKLFIIVFLSFWAYYEFKMIRVFVWKKWGKEKIWIQHNILHYQKETRGKGKINEFNIDLINDLKLVEMNESNFSDFLGQSFWVKGGERIELGHQAKIIRFAMQLNDKEAKILLNEIQSFILNSLDKK